MDPVKVQAIHDWIQPTSVKSLQKFWGFANFYCRFIANFSSVVKPLTDLTKKGADVANWSSAAVSAFQELKRRFTSAPVLRQPDVSLLFQVEVDASEIGAGAVLSQKDPVGSLMKPCAFFSPANSAKIPAEDAEDGAAPERSQVNIKSAGGLSDGEVRLVIAEKALKCEEHDVSLPLSEHNEPWFMRLNPSGEVPVLVHGENIICEAAQIIDYLEQTFNDEDGGRNERIVRQRKLTMVISKETRAAIIALHKNGLTGKSIAATKIAPQSTIYRIIKNFKKRASIVVKKAPGRPRKTSKRQDRILKLFQLQDRTTSSAELAQEWQQAGVSASARTVRRRLFEQGLVSRRAPKKPLLSRKNIRDQLLFCKRYREWTAEDWGKVIFSDESPFRLFGSSGKQLIRRRRGQIGSTESELKKLAQENPDLEDAYIAKQKRLKNKLMEHDNIKYLTKILDELEKVLDQVETELQRRSEETPEEGSGSESWLCGQFFSLADVSLAVTLHRLKFLGFARRNWGNGKRPNLEAYYERILKRKTFSQVLGNVNNILISAVLPTAFRVAKKRAPSILGTTIVMGLLAGAGYIFFLCVRKRLFNAFSSIRSKHFF
ncbi:unnamed protein product [Ranitomeya imitator]|uniref:Ganglioside-induced differentiation-associated protein 1 n=1 Tax=Ranitomeya imitator TaxID=111125 RepID=A0ABN9MDS8_9NEOB|nr:unnamed protein product [Ranitomeya imitator]